MPGLMAPKNKQAVQMIVKKLNGDMSPSSESLKKDNENAVEQLSMVEKEVDDINTSTAMNAAAQSLMNGIESKNPEAIASAIVDMFQLFEMMDDAQETE